jgi:hypothetical protein
LMSSMSSSSSLFPDSASSSFSSSSSDTYSAVDTDTETSPKPVGSPSVMGTWTTERGAVAIPGASEADWLFTDGVTSIARVCWSQIHTSLSYPVFFKKIRDTIFTNSSLELIKYSFHQQMKWNEMNCTVSTTNEMKWNEMWLIFHQTDVKWSSWDASFSWNFMRFHETKKGPPMKWKPCIFFFSLLMFLEEALTSTVTIKCHCLQMEFNDWLL